MIGVSSEKLSATGAVFCSSSMMCSSSPRERGQSPVRFTVRKQMSVTLTLSCVFVQRGELCGVGLCYCRERERTGGAERL